MKVLALASYPVEAAATRYRLCQFVSPLAERGITLSVHPFLDSRLFATLYKRERWPQNTLGLARSSFRRLGDVLRASNADVILVQREAMMFGPPFIEWMMMKVGRCPMVLDLDDATYVRYTSPTYGRLASALKWFGKTDDLIDWAKLVVCGNQIIADYVSGRGARAVVIPTVVDTDLFCPSNGASRDSSGVPVLGWVGTHSTFPFLSSVFPVLQKLSRAHRFRLKVVGAGRPVELPGVEVESLDWNMGREVGDFQSLDIGLYPLIADEFSVGKSGFKAIQYMSVGVPFVMSPVGVCKSMGEAGATHLVATSPDEWHDALALLLSDAERRREMGEAGRRHALDHYTVAAQADLLAASLRSARDS